MRLMRYIQCMTMSKKGKDHNLTRAVGQKPDYHLEWPKLHVLSQAQYQYFACLNPLLTVCIAHWDFLVGVCCLIDILHGELLRVSRVWLEARHISEVEVFQRTTQDRSEERERHAETQVELHDKLLSPLWVLNEDDSFRS